MLIWKMAGAGVATAYLLHKELVEIPKGVHLLGRPFVQCFELCFDGCAESSLNKEGSIWQLEKGELTSKLKVVVGNERSSPLRSILAAKLK
jgi:hypothetical protein